MNEIERNSCVKFVENPQNPRAIKIHDGIGCSANVGMSDNNFVSLQRNWCLGKIGIPIHELLHSLGFHHMQSAFDRDDYVRVLRNNVQDKFLRNFDKFDSSYVSHFGVKYDLVRFKIFIETNFLVFFLGAFICLLTILTNPLWTIPCRK